MGPHFTMLLAMWLVCGSASQSSALDSDGRPGRKVPLASPISSRSARYLRHTGRSGGVEKSTQEEPNPQSFQRRKSVPVLRLAHPTVRPPPSGINGAPVRPELKPIARGSASEMVRDEGSSARTRMLRFPSDPVLPISWPALQERTGCGSSQPLMPQRVTTAS